MSNTKWVQQIAFIYSSIYINRCIIIIIITEEALIRGRVEASEEVKGETEE